jgi:peptidoglycan/LPS O-acetylase OafA/YrhL
MEAHTVGGVGALVFSAAPGPVLFDLGVAVILVFCVTQPTSAIARSFSWSPVAGIGLISYSLYLWQEAVWHAGPIISLALALTLALTSYYVVERPMRRVGRALAQRFADNATDSSEPRHAATAPA